MTIDELNVLEAHHVASLKIIRDAKKEITKPERKRKKMSIEMDVENRILSGKCFKRRKLNDGWLPENQSKITKL